jgi:Cu(I)/Ag(I) efflux system membrane protein CusA/SilA
VSYEFAGSYENQLRSEKRLRILIPLTLALIYLLLYLQFRRTSTALAIFTGVAVAMAGGFLLIWGYNQPGFLDVTLFGFNVRDVLNIGPMNLSVAVWVGFIALLGIATDDGVVMATYLQQRFEGITPDSVEQVREMVLDAGVRRVRPCLMTTATTLLALLPVLTSNGRGSDVMIPMAVPVVGGMMFELVTLFVVPVLWSAREEFRLWWRTR